MAQEPRVLGKSAAYPSVYTPSLLDALPRAPLRAQLGIASDLPFRGADVWNGHEFSWLDGRGRPQTTGLHLQVSAQSGHIIESKSLKLYLGSFAQTRWPDPAGVVAALEADLSQAVQAPVSVDLASRQAVRQQGLSSLPGRSLDEPDADIDDYGYNPGHLAADDADVVEQTLHSHLFRSLCPVTGQPDHAGVCIDYRGPAIDPVGLLRYIVSYRQHQEFGEQIAERMFVDILHRCRPRRLALGLFFTRRGGLDINPWRSSDDRFRAAGLRLWNQ